MLIHMHIKSDIIQPGLNDMILLSHNRMWTDGKQGISHAVIRKGILSPSFSDISFLR